VVFAPAKAVPAGMKSRIAVQTCPDAYIDSEYDEKFIFCRSLG